MSWPCRAAASWHPCVGPVPLVTAPSRQPLLSASLTCSVPRHSAHLAPRMRSALLLHLGCRTLRPRLFSMSACRMSTAALFSTHGQGGSARLKDCPATASGVRSTVGQQEAHICRTLSLPLCHCRPADFCLYSSSLQCTMRCRMRHGAHGCFVASRHAGRRQAHTALQCDAIKSVSFALSILGFASQLRLSARPLCKGTEP